MNYATLPTRPAINAQLNRGGLLASVRENFARNLARLLKEKRISNKDLAAAVGVSGTTITHWLSERNSPELSRLELVARKLGVTPLDLLRDKDDESPVQNREIDALIHEIASARGYKLVPKDS